MKKADNESNNLTEFIKQSKDRLKIILARLEWSEDAVKKTFNTNSIASKQAKKPKQAAPVKITEYPDSCFHHNNVTLETPKLQELLQSNKVEAPRNFQELQLNFKREEKLKIYEHVIENTKKLENNLETPVAEGELSLAEIVAQKKREEKRKKRRFRKSKPTHIEEVKCLVELQMQALKQFLSKTNESERQKRGNKNENKTQNWCHKEYHRECRQNLTDTFGTTSAKCNKKLLKRSHSPSHSKESTTNYRRYRSRSPIKRTPYEYKCRGRSVERELQNRNRSKERRRRSKSKSGDSDTKYKQYKNCEYQRSRRSRSKSPRNRDRSAYFSTQHSRRSRSKSPYRREIKQYSHNNRSPKRKTRSTSKESSYSKAYKKEEHSKSKPTRISSPNCDKHLKKRTFEDLQRSRRSRSKPPHRREIKHYSHHNESPKRKEEHSKPKSTRNSSPSCDTRLEKQPFEDSRRFRRSRSKSPYEREIKQYNHHNKSPKRKRRSMSKESSYYQNREDLCSKNSDKHKHKTKKKKHKRDHS